MPTSRNRLSMRASCTQGRFNTATLPLVIELDRRDIEQGNYRDSDFFYELDREESRDRARAVGDH
ncbi:hypothetical protein R70006_03803 [Paraburkholderia domus]|nr:hypothetical protein R70006_03803 [Paraburkholderia domus]